MLVFDGTTDHYSELRFRPSAEGQETWWGGHSGTQNLIGLPGHRGRPSEKSSELAEIPALALFDANSQTLDGA